MNFIPGLERAIRKRSVLITIVSLLLISTALHHKQVLGSIWTNIALFRFVQTQLCDPEWYLCGKNHPVVSIFTKENKIDELRSIVNLLESASKLNPNNPEIHLLIANVLFELGERQLAADKIDSIDDQISTDDIFPDNAYQVQLIKARQYIRRKEWDKAIQAFRLGLGWGGEETLPIDEQDYFLTLATNIQQRPTSDSEDNSSIYLIGKYLVKAGKFEQARQWLDRAIQQDVLSNEDEAWAYYYKGQVLEKLGDIDGAIQAYQFSIEADPEIRFSYYELIDLLKKNRNENVIDLVNQLNSLGPEYYIGIQADDLLFSSQTSLPNGWTLVGYDIDDSLLEEAHSIDVLLWWRNNRSDDPSLPVEAFKIADYWVQRQQVTNLFPNAGFEWGIDEHNIPLGHIREYYGAPAGSLEIRGAERFENDTQVLKANNTPNNQYIALISRPIPVNAEGYYLISGWIWDQDRLGKMGWICRGEHFGQEEAFYVATYSPLRPVEQWIHVASLTAPFPGRTPEWCDILVTSINSQGGVMWDNILWAQITTP